MLETGEIENVYTLKILNKDERAAPIRVRVTGLAQGDDGRRRTGRYRLDPVSPAFDVPSGEVYNAAVRVRADAWDDAVTGHGDDADRPDDGMASLRFRIEAADDPSLAASAVARFFRRKIERVRTWMPK